MDAKGEGHDVGKGLSTERVKFFVDADKIPTRDVSTPDTNEDNKSTKSITITALANEMKNNNETHSSVVMERGSTITKC